MGANPRRNIIPKRKPYCKKFFQKKEENFEVLGNRFCENSTKPLSQGEKTDHPGNFGFGRGTRQSLGWMSTRTISGPTFLTQLQGIT